MSPAQHAVCKLLITAAANHSENTGEDHEVGDLHDALYAAVDLMTPKQLFKFFRSIEAMENLDANISSSFIARVRNRISCEREGGR